MQVLRVVDCCVDTQRDVCYLYLRDKLGQRLSTTLRPSYEINVGSKYDRMSDLSRLSEDIAKTPNVVINMLGVKQTYYRSQKHIMRIRVSKYIHYIRVLNKIKYGDYCVFLCDDFCSVESRTLMDNDIYGCNYICYDGRTLRAATSSESFEYTPKVAGIDLEMLSLNPVDPSCTLYMASYYSSEFSAVIYTSEYCAQIDNNTIQLALQESEQLSNQQTQQTQQSQQSQQAQQSQDTSYLLQSQNITYIRVEDKYELVTKLADIIAKEAPDVVTGYNIYFADLPLLYFTLRSVMGTWPKMCAGPDCYFQYTKKLEKKYIESDSGTAIKIPGCHVIDMYPFLEKLLPSEEKNSLKLGDVASKYIEESKDPFTYRDLARIYNNGTTTEKLLVMKYCLRDSYLAVRLYKSFNVWNYHSGIYAISGIDAQRSLCTGIVDITYGLCYKRSKLSNILLDEPDNRIFKPSGGLVLTTQQGMYHNVHCIDFNSLYPNIVMQHNIDALSVVKCSYDDMVAIHGKMREHLYYAISTDGEVVGLKNAFGKYVYFYQSSVKTTLPSILSELLSERERIRSLMRNIPEDSVEYKSLSGQEQARKIAANGSCGALGEQTEGNPMSYCLLNDIITTTGRTILGITKQIAEYMHIPVIYGDTDSLMLKADDRIQSYLDNVHKLLPSRIKFKIEYIADVFVMGKKKHYIAKIGDKVKIMGYKSVKSSGCKAANVTLKWLIDILVNRGPETVVSSYNQLLDYYDTAAKDVDMDMFVTRFSYTGKVYAQGTERYNIVKHMRSRGVELVAGNTLSVVIVKTQQEYLRLYGSLPDYITLPTSSEGKAARVYTVGEVEGHPELVDIRQILNTQCGSDISSIMESVKCTSLETAQTS